MTMDSMMSRSDSGGSHGPDPQSPDGDPSLGGNPQDDRSPRPAERASEPGFFEQIVQMLKPRTAAPLRQRFVEALAQTQGTEAGFSAHEQRMLTNLLGMNELRVEDAMVPRSKIEGIEQKASLGQAMRRFEETGHSRMPVYDDGLDDPKGMIHIRDALGHITRAAAATIDGTDATLDLGKVDLSPSIEELGLVRKVLFVPPSMPAADLMARMQATRIQIALVIDEYGGTDGLVSLEDLIEIIVGDIEDEHDFDENLVVQEKDGVYLADARTELEDVRALVGDDFEIAAYEDVADTIGGLVVTELGRIPAPGETVETVPGFRLEVVEADSRRVKRVRLVRRPAATDETPGHLN